MSVNVGGHSFHWYDNSGLVLNDTGDVVGHLDEDRLDVYHFDSDEERRRSEDVITGRIRALATAWLTRNLRFPVID